MIASFSGLRPAAKLGIVVAGYVLAFAGAAFVVRVYMALTSNVDRQGSAGMSAFGDSLVFLAALGVAAVPATGAALFFLRSRRSFWTVLSVASVVVACTALAAVALSIASASASANPTLRSWSMIAPLRILVAPLLALFFLLSGLFAPARSPRLTLLAASATEIISFACVALVWWRSTR